MARPKSEDKRIAILTAATRVFAQHGLSAATSAISREASVAEGTLFTYFATKDDLINALYRQIKLELADAMMSGFPRNKTVRHRLQHVWDCFVNWGLRNPSHYKVLSQLELSTAVTAESRKFGAAPFEEVQGITDDAISQHLMKDIPHELVAAALRALADATIQTTTMNRKAAAQYREAGFEILWGGIARKK